MTLDTRGAPRLFSVSLHDRYAIRAAFAAGWSDGTARATINTDCLSADLRDAYLEGYLAAQEPHT